jgi:hypothetical protein
VAKIILKSPYLKPGAKPGRGGYIYYIATRAGVERPTDTKLQLAATRRQSETAASLIKDCPDLKELYEYEDYLKNPNRANAIDFIARAAETHSELIEGRQGYVEYIATRPGTEMVSDHGLFADAGVPVVLERAAREVSEHGGNVWCHIVSLRREDAERLGYNNAYAWENLLRSQRNVIAKAMKISPKNFRWYAAFHNESHHPHVHMACFSANPNEAWLSPKGIMDIKSALARQIFRQDLLCIYEKQTEHRDELRREGKDTAKQIVTDINSGVYDNPEAAEMLLGLSLRLKNTSGKKVYGYLKADVKLLVNRITDELAKDERIAKLYNLWYGQREAAIRTYTDKMPPRLPLSQNPEFKTIRNAVIQEAERLLAVESNPAVHDALPIAEAQTGDIGISALAEAVMTDFSGFADGDGDSREYSGGRCGGTYGDGHQERYCAAWNDEYGAARKHLHGTNNLEKNFEKAYALMSAEAARGNALALYDTGRMHMDGLGRSKNEIEAQRWFAEAYRAFLAAEEQWENPGYIQYRLGKMHENGDGTEKDCAIAADWYECAVRGENPFAAYSLGRLHYDGRGATQDFGEAFSLYAMAARLSSTANSGGKSMRKNRRKALGYEQIHDKEKIHDKIYSLYRRGKRTGEEYGPRFFFARPRRMFETLRQGISMGRPAYHDQGERMV